MRNSAGIISTIALLFILHGCQQTIPSTLEQRADKVSRPEMESITELLGHDLYEGRAPGTRGGDLAEIYMQSLFKFMGLEPGAGESYFQPFLMKGFSNSGFTVDAGGSDLVYLEDVVGTFPVEEETVDLRGEAVFVGFGISTDLWEWDDYKNIDVTDKIVITRVNDSGGGPVI